MSAVGQRIKQERERRGVSQYRLAKLSGVSQPTISAIEADDQTRSPAVDTVEKIARALGCQGGFSLKINGNSPILPGLAKWAVVHLSTCKYI